MFFREVFWEVDLMKRFALEKLIEWKDKQKCRISYKIFEDNKALEIYLKKNKDKVCEKVQPVFSAGEYVKYKDTQVKKLSAIEIEKYMSERK